MIKDITLGQYFPLDSVIHKIDPRFKIIFTILYIILVFFADSLATYSLVALFCIAVIFLSRVNFSLVLKSIKPLVFVILLTGLINVFLTNDKNVIWSYGFLKVTELGLRNAVNMALRLVFLVVGSSMLTYTTSPIMLTDGMERLLKPFSIIGLPSHEIAMMMTIALRFIPTLLEETQKIMTAQKARGADFESGNIVKRAKALIPVLIPLFINAFKRADELSTAMECRCYRGGTGRTRLRELKSSKCDYIALAVMLLFSVFLISFNVLSI